MRHLIWAPMALGLAFQAAAQQMPGNPDIAAGEALYQDNCASCHGEELQGQEDWRSARPDGVLPAPPHDQTGHTWHHGDKLLFGYTKLGGADMLASQGIKGFKSGMPGFGKSLSDDDIWNILAFVQSTWSDRIREIQAVRTQGEQMRDN